MREKKFDTFGADILQIKILKPGLSMTHSGLKRRNAREGPFDIIGTDSSSAKSEEPGRNEKRSKQMERKGTSASSSAHAKGDESKRTEK
jgi:hypothetical protein